MTAEEVARRLDPNARRSGDEWAVRCPAHDDRTASASVGYGRDGRVLVHCHAGCTPEAMLGEVGLTFADLWNGSTPPSRATPERARIVATDDYADEAGTLLFHVVRKEPKKFFQRHRCPDLNAPGRDRDGFTWTLGNKPEKCACPEVRHVLYHFPQLIEAVALGRSVYVSEGEKDVHALEGAGAVATCNPGGAGKWRREYGPAFRGARVRVVADRDAPGLAHAQQVAAALEGIALSVEIVQARAGKDAADHIAAGHTLEDFKPVTPDEMTPLESNEVAPPEEVEPLYDPQAIQFGRYMDTEPPERRMIVGGWLPLGVVGLLVSMGGLGKSRLLYQLCLSVVTGMPFLGMAIQSVGSVLYIAAEDEDEELHRRGRDLLHHYRGDARLGGQPLCQCQKQPCTKMAFFFPRCAISGRPGRPGMLRRYRYPSPAMIFRTVASAAVPRCRTRLMRADRAAVVWNSIGRWLRASFPSLDF